MELIKEFLTNKVVIENIGTLVGVLVLFGLAFLFNDRYNKGGREVNIWLARILAVMGCIVVIVWFFI